MIDFELLIRWWAAAVKAYFNNLYRFQLYRRYKGGLWINFKDGQWAHTEWHNKNTGYIKNKFDGGVYHKRFNLIVSIEDYTE